MAAQSKSDIRQTFERGIYEMKRTILTGVMIIGLAATSAFAASAIDAKQGGGGSKGKTAAASTGSTMAANTGSTHKRRHHHRRHHRAVAHKHATTKSK